MTLLATLVRALASLPRRHRCVHGCGGEPAPKKEHAR